MCVAPPSEESPPKDIASCGSDQPASPQASRSKGSARAEDIIPPTWRARLRNGSRRNSTEGSPLLGNLIVKKRYSSRDACTGLESWGSLFTRFARDGELHQDLLPQVLELAGVLCPREAWIGELFRGITKYTMLDRSEFEDFVEAFEQRVREEHSIAFSKCDHSGAHEVQVSTLGVVLAYLGITVTERVIADIVKEVDEEKTGVLDFLQFETFMGLLSTHQGFSKREYERLMSAFTVYDVDHSGDLDHQEVMGILGYLDYSLRAEDATGLIKEVPSNMNGKLGRREFLLFMRKVREYEVGRIQIQLSQLEASATKEESLLKLLRCLGYVVDRDAVCEAAVDAGLELKSSGPAVGASPWANATVTMAVPTSNSSSRRPSVLPSGSSLVAHHSSSSRRPSIRGRRTLKSPSEEVEDTAMQPKSLSLSEAWEFLEVFRIREGFTRMEVEAIESIFQKYASQLSPEDAGGISTLDAGRALQWLGYESPYEVLQQLASEVDIDGSGNISMLEFRKLVRKHREREFKQIRMTLQEAGVNVEQNLHTTKDWKAAKEAINFTRNNSKEVQFPVGRRKAVSGGQLSTALRTAGAGLQEISRKSYLPQSLGGTHRQLHNGLRARFDEFDHDADGQLDREQFRLVCAASFQCENSASLHLAKEMTRLVDDAQADGQEHFNFNDVQSVTQRFYDFCLMQKMVKEQQTVENSQFTLGQVRGFREVFNEADVEELGYISFDALGRMLGAITPLNDRLTRHLAEVWVKFAPSKAGADFPDFLQLMQHLLEVNFADLKGQTAHFGQH